MFPDKTSTQTPMMHYNYKIIAHFLPAVGSENPLVIKSSFFGFPSFEFFVKRLPRFSFMPIIFLLLFFSFSSSSTRAVSFAVAACLIPFGAPGVGVDVLLRLVPVLCSFCARGASSAGSPLPGFFFRFLEPGAFLREWVRPDSDSLCDRARRLCLSESLVGRIGMTLSSVYDSLH